ncbi:hypothetical protein [Micromonospora sp. H61]|uniref:PD-(D/E)XK nuclease domain-containing protein n=1 Tax=Micromonospora sp. H61 TaxID=2824888 RepID=UPI0027DE4198|nr:hypothetical protein [Micromonospora sp. H61]
MQAHGSGGYRPAAALRHGMAQRQAAGQRDPVHEEPLPRLGHSSHRADFGIPRLGVLIEIKYVRSATEFKKVEKEILEDSIAYLRERGTYTKLIVFIYDASASNQEHDITSAALLERDDIIDVIIVSRPIQLPETATPAGFHTPPLPKPTKSELALTVIVGVQRISQRFITRQDVADPPLPALNSRSSLFTRHTGWRHAASVASRLPGRFWMSQSSCQPARATSLGDARAARLVRGCGGQNRVHHRLGAASSGDRVEGHERRLGVEAHTRTAAGQRAGGVFGPFLDVCHLSMIVLSRLMLVSDLV